MPGVSLVGSGSACLTVQLTNDDLSQRVDTSDDWIATRTGIRQRHIATPQDSLASLAAEAARNALAMAAVSAEEVDLIVLATSTPDDLFGTACQVQKALGATRAVAFDLTAACSGFVFALVTAAQYIRTGVFKNVVVIGADVLSRWTDWDDRTTCVLFGDGAGAVVLRAAERDRLLGFELCSDGSLNHCLNLAYQPESDVLVGDITVQKGTFAPITMNGREVYKFAVNRVPEVIEKALFRANLTTADINWLVLHQANQRILDAVADRLNVPAERVVSNMARHGNTSAASIPIALDEAVRAGKIKAEDVIATAGFGAGLTWGSAIIQWG
ncbi:MULTISPECIES: beta-ketoacyl-ACP synthase III [Cyanophyceae]|uniref:beta-ketoacyl-ACP synthase III n=1 Tax=Cyanophyceae TaxID=3028117 RepID=UPI001685DAE2|nr:MULTISPECIES: beta-ketoacyl-ACP synthase III [Cyanophyceae]MBD1916943.1 ketoacyl-ACP synthase III [Phormidium sp. FACHB-77]MBD2029794.1 ketoacyl-ACP synthase III [Phormidium sp. FACHB-322]MBD2050418.1 ketoacyl-ACP synthase III [Leptolyngbya sp. FACHB-60]